MHMRLEIQNHVQSVIVK